MTIRNIILRILVLIIVIFCVYVVYVTSNAEVNVAVAQTI